MPSKRKRGTAGPSAGGGDDTMLAVDDAASSMATKYRESLDGAANEFLCPITQELPVEPVTAMDGKVYERKAIEDWFRQGNGNSPMTNQPMSNQLLPATHVRNSLELMVKSGALTGEKVDAWTKKLKDEESMAKLLEKAQAGDLRAMASLGYRYDMQDKDSEAFSWYRRGADAGNLDCLALLGGFYVRGNAMDEAQPSLGLVMITEAAMNGCTQACCYLAEMFFDGEDSEVPGLKKDKAQAAKWYRKMLECADTGRSLRLNTTIIQEARDWLRRYDEAQAAAAAGGAAAE